MFVEQYFLLANFTTSVTRCNGRAAHSETAQTLEFTASFLTHILTSLTLTFFPQAGMIKELGQPRS
jgi:hypothetical protein